MKFLKIRFLATGTTVIMLSILSIIISCSKDLNNSEKVTELDNLRMKKVILTPYNQKLLDDFMTNTKKYFVEEGLNARASRATLRFVSAPAYSSYNSELNNLANSWDGLNGASVPANANFVLSENPGNPAFNAVDQALNFASARYDYNFRRELSGDRGFEFQSNQAAVTDPYFQRTMNLDQEVIIGDYVYKQLPNNVIAKIPANNSSAIESVRLNGKEANVEMVLLDDNTGETITKGTLDTRGSCTHLAFANQQGSSTLVKVSSVLTNMTGGGCGGIFRYNFGDGSSEVESTGGGFTHTYDVPLGTFQTFTATVTFLRAVPGSSCVPCDGISAKVTFRVNNFGDCHDKEVKEKKEFIDFTASSGTQQFPACITAKFGFRGKAQGSFIQTAAPKVWLNTYFEILKDGKWRSATPGVPIEISTHGFVKTNQCAADQAASFSKSIKCSSDELLVTNSSGIGRPQEEQVPSIFGIIETNRTISLWGKVTFGPILYDKPFWEWPER